MHKIVFGIRYTECSLNVVFFAKILLFIFRTLASLGFPKLCKPATKWQVEKSQDIKEKTQYLMNTLYMNYNKTFEEAVHAAAAPSMTLGKFILVICQEKL